MFALVAFSIKRSDINRWCKWVCLLLAILVLLFKIYFFATGIYILMGLVVRPFFLIFYSPTILAIMKKFLRVVYNCLQYFGLMWFLLIMWSSVGISFFSDI